MSWQEWSAELARKMRRTMPRYQDGVVSLLEQR
jgi:hypothetical protein